MNLSRFRSLTQKKIVIIILKGYGLVACQLFSTTTRKPLNNLISAIILIAKSLSGEKSLA